MKNILFIVCLFFTSYSFANNTDSTQVKLKKYKDMFSEGLINETEYSKLKQNLLFPFDEEIKSNENEINVKELKQKSLGQIIGGTVLMAGGFTSIGIGVNYKKNKYPNPLDYYSNGKLNTSSLEKALKTYRSRYITFITFGSVLAGVGFALDILGIHNKSVYINKNKNISLGMSNEGIGASLRFN
jgi:hypothetical protein